MKPSVYSLFTRTNLKRKSFKEYKKMTKPNLLRSLQAFIANYDQLRNAYKQKCLEYAYLERRVKVLERHIFLLTKDGKRNFKNVGKGKKRTGFDR